MSIFARPLVRSIAAFCLLLAIVIGITVGLYAFPVRFFSIGSGSMLPTIVRGDYLLVLARHPSPQRGDIVAFSYPADPSVVYVARLVGLPGDRIQMIQGLLHINGQPVKRTRVEDFIDADEKSGRVKQWSETLPGGATHRTLDLLENSFYDDTPVYAVPDGQYFMMGDNRDNSSDSRVKSRTVPTANLIGRVIFCLRGSCSQ
jgi:signal peptidase I